MAAPSYILRNCTLYVGAIDLLGEVEQITLPVPSVKTEEIRNAGMVMPIDVNMGYEKLEASFRMPGLNPAVLAQFGLAPGVRLPLMATGALVDEDGATHSAVCYMQGFIKKADMGDWKPGEKSEAQFEVCIREYSLSIDGVEVIGLTPFEVRIAGVSQTSDIARALLSTAA